MAPVNSSKYDVLKNQSSLSSTFKSVPRKPRAQNPKFKLKQQKPHRQVTRKAAEESQETNAIKSESAESTSSDDSSHESAIKELLSQWTANDPSPRFHQSDLTDTDRLMRLFDLNPDFGPCVGLTRLERWHRAEKFGQNPPKIVKAVLENPDHKDLAKSVFSLYSDI